MSWDTRRKVIFCRKLSVDIFVLYRQGACFCAHFATRKASSKSQIQRFVKRLRQHCTVLNRSSPNGGGHSGRRKSGKVTREYRCCCRLSHSQSQEISSLNISKESLRRIQCTQDKLPTMPWGLPRQVHHSPFCPRIKRCTCR